MNKLAFGFCVVLSVTAFGGADSALAGARADQLGDRIDNRLDRKGDRIERHHDRRADVARAHGRDRMANRIEGRGNRIDNQLDRRGDRIDRRPEPTLSTA